MSVSFERVHAQQIVGTLTTVDRLIVDGHLQSPASAGPISFSAAWNEARMIWRSRSPGVTASRRV